MRSTIDRLSRMTLSALVALVGFCAVAAAAPPSPDGALTRDAVNGPVWLADKGSDGQETHG